MGVISKFFGEKRRLLEDKKRSEQFVRIFGRVSSELGLFHTGLTPDLVVSLFDSMGQGDNSADIFVQIVLVFHSYYKEGGLTIMKHMGKSSIKGFDAEELFDKMKYHEADSLHRVTTKVVRQIQKMIEITDKKVQAEPVALLMAFIRRLEEAKERALFREEARDNEMNGTMSLIDRMRNVSMEPRMNIHQRDIDQSEITKVQVPIEPIDRIF